MFVEPWRPDPKLPAHLYQSYGLLAPKSTHFRRATCAEVDCPNYVHGWMNVIEDVIDADGLLKDTLRHCGRKYEEYREEGKTTFVFEAGQPCLKASTHTKRIEREPLYVVSGGDFRGDPLKLGRRFHTKPEFWVEDFAEHQIRVKDIVDRG